MKIFQRRENGFAGVSDFRQGDLFRPFDEDARFGLVVANSPQTPSTLIEPGGLNLTSRTAANSEMMRCSELAAVSLTYAMSGRLL